MLLKYIFVLLLAGFAVIGNTAVHTGQLEVATFLGRQKAQTDGNATFSGGIQLGFEIVEIGVLEFSAETGFGSYPDNGQKVRNFDIGLRSVLYRGEMLYPYIMGGFGLMTYNRSSKSEGESSVTFARTTTNFGMGFKLRIKKDLFGRLDQKYFLFARDGSLTYRSLTSLGLSYSF